MTYENLVKAAKKAANAVDSKVIKEHLAVEFDVEGKGEGAFYVEFTSKAVEVEPYEYYDHDFRVRTDADTALAILNGETTTSKALESGKAVVEGNEYKIGLLDEYLKAEIAVKKTTKKAPAKKTATKAAEKKPADKKATEKKAADKKPVPKKVAKKPATK